MCSPRGLAQRKYDGRTPSSALHEPLQEWVLEERLGTNRLEENSHPPPVPLLHDSCPARESACPELCPPLRTRAFRSTICGLSCADLCQTIFRRAGWRPLLASMIVQSFAESPVQGS